jgi:type IV pilus assembly protein PilY1
VTNNKYLAALFLVVSQTSFAQLTSTDFAAVPPLITENAPPNVMLLMSNDHELYKKAYTDFTDLNRNGIIDEGYDDSITYAGYFDSNFCYIYNESKIPARFEPASNISDLIKDNGHACNIVTGDWSGNFLNWASMTKMDIVRHVLFGGKRIVDTGASESVPGQTVIERTEIPEDAHAFAKIFVGDTRRYTPWNQNEISLCNVTVGAENNPPLLRVAFGVWPLWASSEKVQCYYRQEYDSHLSTQPDENRVPLQHDFAVRVGVCLPGIDASSQRCKPYTHNSSGVITYKPVGLLQQYGDSGLINFGLMTGSYNKKISGGVLRKNISKLTGNGDASLDEISINTGVFLNQTATSAGIINTISRFRLTSWNYAPIVNDKIHDDCAPAGISKQVFITSTAPNQQCRNWGNPLAEMYLEALRYFTGINKPLGNTVPDPTFNTSDENIVASLPQLSWSDPLDQSNACSTCSIIVISSSFNSFDKDELHSVNDLWDEVGTTRMTSASLNNLLDKIGTLEGISGVNHLIGSNGVNNNDSCTFKTINKLSQVNGICPGAPSLEGGYEVAALAYHANTKDLRYDLDGIQSVRTYTISLADDLPIFELDVNGKNLILFPSCQSHPDPSRKLDQLNWNNCTFLDLKIEKYTEKSGSITVVWEDSLWGSDYDMDVVSRIEWCIGADTSFCPAEPEHADYNAGFGQTGFTYADFEWKNTGINADTLQIRTSAVLSATESAIRLGFNISGVDEKGTTSVITNTPNPAISIAPTSLGVGSNQKYIARGHQGNGDQFFLLLEGNYSIRRLVENDGNRIIYHQPLIYTSNSSLTSAALIKNPLFYAAKYGNFNDIDGDGTPTYGGNIADSREWDILSLDGNEIPDGIPDNFIPVSNPGFLTVSLANIFKVISAKISSGTAAAVVANSSTGLGAVYQAYYHPSYTDSNGHSVSWGGVLHALFIDESGRFREDNGINGKLENTDTDYVIDIFYDQTVQPNRTRFQRYLQIGSGPGAILSPLGLPDDLENIGSIWNARDVLADMNQETLHLQRSLDNINGNYAEPAQDKRYIFTYLDDLTTGTYGKVDAGEIVDFIPNSFGLDTIERQRYFALDDSNEVSNIIRFVRGEDLPGYRSRLVDIPGDGTTTPKHWILGDIIHSSPLVINPPSARYDLMYGDSTYDLFRQKYSRRRQMVYAGANDGMLHAFNAGVWDPVARSFSGKAYDPSTNQFNLGPDHKLGAEMWAYVPMNLLPHLKWLGEENYPHVYYMDGAPISFDVNIFTPDSIHPGGWGTVLVAGMRLGGGQYPLDLDGDGIDETVMRSSYVILDVTDPERPPTLLAEITAPDMGYTTSIPTLVKARLPDSAGSFANPSVNRWMLVFGSGPDSIADVTRSSQPKLYAYDLVAREMIPVSDTVQVSKESPTGFYGDFLSVDWNGDNVDDVVYVGTIEGTQSNSSGRLKRIVLTNDSSMGLGGSSAVMSDFLFTEQPIASRPVTRIDFVKNERWVSFASGRLFTRADTQSSQLFSVFGIKEPATFDTSLVTIQTLVDSTPIIVMSNGNIYNANTGATVVLNGQTLPTYNSLYAHMDSRNGWVRNLYFVPGQPSERVFNSPLLLGSSLVYGSFLPSDDLCRIEGNGFLNAVNFRTGTAEIFAPFGVGNGAIFSSVNLGQGAPSTPTAIIRTGNDPTVNGNEGNLTVITGSTTGVTDATGFITAPIRSARMSWEMLNIPF